MTEINTHYFHILELGAYAAIFCALWIIITTIYKLSRALDNWIKEDYE